MKKSILTLLFSTLAILTMSCDAESLLLLVEQLGGIKGCTTQIPEKCDGCTGYVDNGYDSTATIPDASMCDVPYEFGCKDVNAQNYSSAATDDDGTCNVGTSGCMDPYLANYDATATTSDPSACGDPITTAGCTLEGSCNYNKYATSDCSNNAVITDQSCCQAPTTPTASSICYLDFNDNGYYEEMKVMITSYCSCDENGYGWSDNSNGEELAGCMDPTCPEYDPDYNMNNYQCCITDFSEYGIDSTFLETNEFSLLGGYEMVMGDDCGNQEGGSSSDTETGFIFLGWDFLNNTGIYFTEMERTHTVTGFPGEPAWDWEANNQASCEDAAEGGPWWCENDQQGGWDQNFMPCHEMFFSQECWTNPECTWQDAQCSEAPNTTHQACWQSSNKTTCETNNGCWWEDGIDDGGYQYSEAYCYFDCWGLSTTECNLTNGECSVNTVGDSYSFCSAPIVAGVCSVVTLLDKTSCENAGAMWTSSTIPGPAQCYAADALASSGAWCEWYPDWDQDVYNYNVGQCECYGGTTCESICEGCNTLTVTEPAYCEWAPETNSCTAHTNETSCWNDWDHYCFWEYEWDQNDPNAGKCQQEYWYSEGGDGAACWDYGWETGGWDYDAYGAEVSCQGNDVCAWNDPGADAGNPTWAMPGLCMNWDPCHYMENYNEGGYQNQNDCNDDYNCHWDQGQGGQPGGCYENAYEQWCDCRYEYTSETCDYPMVWEAFDNWNGQCMNPMDQWTCEYGYMGGPGDGYIDCSEYEEVDRFQEWSGSTCTETKSEFEEGEWYIEGSSLCHTAEEEIDCSDIDYFEECECARECHWNGNGDPQIDPYFWENNGDCSGNDNGPNDGSGGSRAKAHINPRINGTNSIFENVNSMLLEFLYSSSPEGFECLPMTLKSNGDILLEDAGDGGCSVTLVRIDDI